MFTTTLTKKLTWEDDKWIWLSTNKSVPYGYNDNKFNEDETIDRIISNCAKSVNISKTEFMEYLGCTREEFKKYLINQLHDYTLIFYGKIWNIDFHTTKIK